jgi:hypothetical protein
MNDRLKELAIQSGLLYRINAKSKKTKRKKRSLKLFAKLIVSECFIASMKTSNGFIDPSRLVSMIESRIGIKPSPTSNDGVDERRYQNTSVLSDKC